MTVVEIKADERLRKPFLIYVDGARFGSYKSLKRARIVKENLEASACRVEEFKRKKRTKGED